VAAARAELAAAAIASKRDPSEVTLLAATKTRTADEVRAVLAAGADAAGENRAQELGEKLGQGAYGETKPHFIGALQTNKVKLVAGRAALIHSVDSVRLGSAIGSFASARNITQDVLIEINIGGEANKSGVAAHGAEALAGELYKIPGLRVRGAMAIPPEGAGAKRYFSEMRELFLRLKASAPAGFDVLSMGMSADFREAVAEGSTLVRLGSILFGPRVY